MIIIEKSKYIRKCLTAMAIVLLIYCTTLCYFLGWQVSMTSLLIYFSIMLVEIVLLLLLNLTLTKLNNSLYSFESNSIKFLKKTQEIFVLEKNSIIKLTYVRFRWIFLLQMGAGYLHIEYNGDKKDIKPSITYPDGKKLYSISMSLKQAIQISKIMNVKVTIK